MGGRAAVAVPDWVIALLLFTSLFMFTIRSLSSRRVSGGAAGAVLASDGEVFRVLSDDRRASLAAT